MNVYICRRIMKVGNAPVGLFLLKESNTLICISEYMTCGTRDAYLVESGENYCGQGDDAEGYSLVIK